MRGADVYHGATAQNYDASRKIKPKWINEINAVRDFLDAGPVLDMPVGTGRFVALYRDKGLDFTGVDISDDMLSIALQKYPGMDARKGSAFDATFEDQSFATVVCIRFMEWLPLERTAFLIGRLKQLAPTLIVSINHGIEGEPEAFTYDYGKFLRAIDGLLIEDRRVTAKVKGITSEIFKLRPAKWSDVLDQFAGRPEEPQRILDKHCGLCGIPKLTLTETVRAEYWEPERISGALSELTKRHAGFERTAPRRSDGPITVVEHGGLTLIVDGLRRAQLWQKRAGPHPVLVIR